MSISDTGIFHSRQGIYYVEQGVVYRNHAPVAGFFGSVPALNHKGGEYGNIHKRFGGPKLMRDGHLCDFVAASLGEGRVLIVMDQKLAGMDWQQTEHGVLILNPQAKEPLHGYLQAYRLVAGPLTCAEQNIASARHRQPIEDTAYI